MRILVSGSLAYDRIMDYPGRFTDHIIPEKVHTLSVSFVTDDLSEHFGGTAGSIAYSLALVGERPNVLAAVGHDFAPYREWLERAGVDLGLVRTVPAKPTMFATIMTDRADNQITSVYLGTMGEGSLLDAAKLASFDAADTIAIVAPGNLDEMRALPRMYREAGIRFLFDPGQQIPQLDADGLRNGIDGAAALISNDYELSLIVDKTGWSEEEILKRAQMIVTTLGEKGSRIRTAAGAIYDIPAAPVAEVVDPTGAGDAYRSGFLKGFIHNWPLEAAGRFGALTAAYAIEARGPQGHSFTLDQARERYEHAFGEALPS